MCLCAYLSVCLYICLSACLSLCYLSICSSVCMLICMLVYLCVCLSACLLICLPATKRIKFTLSDWSLQRRVEWFGDLEELCGAEHVIYVVQLALPSPSVYTGLNNWNIWPSLIDAMTPEVKTRRWYRTQGPSYRERRRMRAGSWWLWFGSRRRYKRLMKWSGTGDDLNNRQTNVPCGFPYMGHCQHREWTQLPTAAVAAPPATPPAAAVPAVAATSLFSEISSSHQLAVADDISAWTVA